MSRSIAFTPADLDILVAQYKLKLIHVLFTSSQALLFHGNLYDDVLNETI